MHYEALPQYLSRHMDDYHLRHQHSSQYASYNQKWMTVDAFPLQLEANFGPISVKVLDCDGVVLLSQTATIARTHRSLIGFFVYEVTISWATFPPGIYFIILELPEDLVLVSEPQEVAETWENTMLVKYKNSTYHGDVLFETGFNPNFRVEARLARMDPGTERTAYTDQRYNPSVLKAVPYRTWELVTAAIPDWLIEKLNWVFSCDEVILDGKLYAVFGDSKWELEEIDPEFPLRVATLKVQEGLNRASKIVDVAVDTNKRLVVGVQIDGTIFGDLSEQAGSNLIPINDIE